MFTLSNAEEGKQKKLELNFNPGLALMGFSGTGGHVFDVTEPLLHTRQ